MKNLYTKIAEYHKKGVKLEKDKQNPYFKSMYMSLDNIVNTITPVLNEVGLVLIHNVSTYEGKSYVVSVLADPESSESIQSSFPIHGTDPQKVGSEISYGKRYNTSCLLNIVDSEDDDGNSATDDIKGNVSQGNNAPIRDDVPQMATGPSEWFNKPQMEQLFKELHEGVITAPSSSELVKKARQRWKVSKAMEGEIATRYQKEFI